MPVLQDAQRELFAQNIVSGMSVVDAYAAAGYKRHASSASRLLSNANVKARVEELKIIAADRSSYTAADVINMMFDVIEEAREEGQFGPVVTALVKLGIERDLFVQKSEVTHNHVTDKAEQLAAARSRAKNAMNGHYKH
jgi:hypothetical protein